MLSSGRKPSKKRGHASVAPSPLVVSRHKRSAKSPGRPRERSRQATSVPETERDIVLDRLGKEIVPLLRAGGGTRERVRRRLRMGINEVTKFLEATAAAAASSDHLGRKPVERKDSVLVPAIVLISRDVRPGRLVEHLHALVALTGMPHLVLPEASGPLGRMLGCKTMAAFAICPPPRTPASTADNTEKRSKVEANADAVRAADGQDRSGVSTVSPIPKEGVPPQGVPEGGGGGGGRQVSAGAALEGQGAGEEQAGGDGSGGRLLPVDDDVDSFVDFLRQKVIKAPA